MICGILFQPLSMALLYHNYHLSARDILFFRKSQESLFSEVGRKEGNMQSPVVILIGSAALLVLVVGGLSGPAHYYTLNGIRNKTVGHGQHGTARWARKGEVRRTFAHVPFAPKLRRDRFKVCVNLQSDVE
jgi:hypothetical protein